MHRLLSLLFAPSFAGTLSLAILFGCAKAPAPLPLPADDAARDAEIAEIEERIAVKRQRLEDLVTRPKNKGDLKLHEDASLREIAAELEADRLRLLRIRQLEVSDSEPTALP